MQNSDTFIKSITFGLKKLVWLIQSLFKGVRKKRGWAEDILHLAMSMEWSRGICYVGVTNVMKS